MNRSSLLLVGALLISGSASDCEHWSGAGVPDKWYAYRTGKRLPSDVITCANHSEYEWHLAQVSGKILLRQRDRGRGLEPPLPASLRPNSRLRYATSSLELPTGWLVGINHGEFGGGLWFVDAAGHETKLANQNVVRMERFDKTVIALTGLAHMGTNEGALYSVNLEKPVDKPKKLVDLGSAPYAHFRESESALLITTNQRVLRFELLGRIETLKEFDGLFLYPTSIVKGNDGSVYVAMRFFVLRLIPNGKGYTEQWLLPTACRSFGLHWPEYGKCGCRPGKKELQPEYRIE